MQFKDKLQYKLFNNLYDRLIKIDEYALIEI
jgi:hypothetical protein